MKERLNNNAWLKILSIFLAFFVWLLVVNVSNPEVTRSQDVPLEIENESVLKDAGRTYEVNGKQTVTVYYDVHTLDEYKIRPSDFRAYIDLSELYDVTGSVQVKVEVLSNKQIIRNATVKPGVAKVSTEELQEKKFTLSTRTQGSPEDGYAVNETSVTPMYVMVEGPISQVGMISFAGVEINIDGQNEDMEGVTAPVFYDANGNELELSDRVQVNTSEIRYQVQINKVKNLPLDFQISGTAAPGYRYTGADCNVKSIAVSGLKSNLASLNMITVAGTDLNVDGAREDRVVTVDVRDYLPEGVSIAATENPILEIHLRIEPLTNRTIILTGGEVALENTVEGMSYRMIPNRVEVTLRGLQEDLNSINGVDLKASVDVLGMEEGIHSAELKFGSNEVFTVVNKPEIQIEAYDSTLGPGGSAATGTSAADPVTGQPENGSGNTSGNDTESQESEAGNGTPNS